MAAFEDDWVDIDTDWFFTQKIDSKSNNFKDMLNSKFYCWCYHNGQTCWIYGTQYDDELYRQFSV